jgi:ribonuclease VapC
MPAAVLDASAILALLQGKPGAALVAPALPTALVGAVNYSEVLGKLVERGSSPAVAARHLSWLGLPVAPFDTELAELAAALVPLTRRRGLSFGDRACLALARQLGLPAFTADRRWAGLDCGVEIRQIR